MSITSKSSILLEKITIFKGKVRLNLEKFLRQDGNKKTLRITAKGFLILLC